MQSVYQAYLCWLVYTNYHYLIFDQEYEGGLCVSEQLASKLVGGPAALDEYVAENPPGIYVGT